ncbi:Retrovirus-related Pol polyprotein from transposon 297 [Vitis vinifera]|uniref:Retrovirus-related Pol polyprotein from transposon 297 n=1 Tax=Vitis vinifera TaxID=29760 RepID=A0A438BS64_VITVI|nr:Retrovirus-related Pol polyprotein from transposon 297 [Vitis vinifera]
MEGMQNDLSHKIDNIQYSISRLTNLNTVNEKESFPLNQDKIPRVFMKLKPKMEVDQPLPNVGHDEELMSKRPLIKESNSQEEKSEKKSASKSSIEEEPRIVIKEDMMKKHMPPPFPQALHGKKEIKNSSEILEVLRQVKSKSPVKYKDPGCPTISVNIGGTHVEKALLDLGASVNLLPYSVYKQLGLRGLKPTTMTLSLADRNGVMQLTFGNMTLELNIFHLCKRHLHPEEEEGFEEPGSAEDGFPEPSDVLAIMSPWRRREEILPLFNQEDSQGVAVEDPPKLILKPLPVDLKYAYLEDDEKCPVVVSSTLTSDQEDSLLGVLRKCKKAIGWQISDLKGISPLRWWGEVLKLLQAGIIYPISDSLWVSPTQVVPKKSGITVIQNEKGEEVSTRPTSGWRVCIDYRRLNSVTRKDHFPLPFMDQVLERVSGHPFYCFLDGYSGYFQIEIDLEDQEKTTFTCPFGTFAYRRMPFGLCNAPATFQRCMLSIFSDMVERIMEVFMDDITVYGMPFYGTKGIVLGHIISKNGIEVDKAKVELIVKLPPPTNVKGIRQFLGHAGFYRSFEELKQFLTTAPIVRAPNWKLPFEVMCDSSDLAMGAVLGQREDGKPYVIYYASKTLNEAQRNYTTTEKELLAVVFALDKFRAYLVGSSIVVFTDHSALKLVIAHDSHGLPINDDFPEESLMSIDVAPWYSHIANFLVTGEVPKQSGILSHCHDSACGGHFASQKTAMKVIQSGFWWPSLFKDAHSMCKGCDRCQRLDFMGPFPMSFGHSYILVGVDYVSKWVEAIPSKYGVKHKVATPYHPQTSGQVELANREIKNILMKVVNVNRKDWSIKLLDSLWAYRTAYKTILECLPIALFMAKRVIFQWRLNIKHGKLKSRWTGPFIIHEVHPNGVVEVFNPTGNQTFKVNGHRLKPFIEPYSTDKEEINLLEPHNSEGKQEKNQEKCGELFKSKQGSKTRNDTQFKVRNFARWKSRCEFLSPKGGNFAHLNKLRASGNSEQPSHSISAMPKTRGGLSASPSSPTPRPHQSTMGSAASPPVQDPAIPHLRGEPLLSADTHQEATH